MGLKGSRPTCSASIKHMDDYFIAIVPPKRSAEIVSLLRQKYAKYHTFHTPPHITIYPPFCLKAITEKKLIKLLKSKLSGISSFHVSMDSIGYFVGKNNVAYLKPDQESQKHLKRILVRIVASLKGYIKDIHKNYNVTPQKYQPHMTIAKKIPPKVLPKIKKQLNLEKVDLQFDVSSLKLFKQQKGSNIWRAVADINFNKSCA